MNIDKVTCEMVMSDAKVALAEVFAKYGLEIGRVNGKYGDSIELRITGAKVQMEGGVNVATPEAIAFKRYARGMNIDENALGETFTSGGREFVLTGYLVRGQRYQFSGRSVADGRSFKFTADTIRRAFPAAVRV